MGLLKGCRSSGRGPGWAGVLRRDDDCYEIACPTAQLDGEAGLIIQGVLRSSGEIAPCSLALDHFGLRRPEEAQGLGGSMRYPWRRALTCMQFVIGVLALTLAFGSNAMAAPKGKLNAEDIILKKTGRSATVMQGADATDLWLVRTRSLGGRARASL